MYTDERDWRDAPEQRGDEAVVVSMEDAWPDWYCYSDACGAQFNAGHWLNCVYCGEWRSDIDELVGRSTSLGA